MKGLFLIQQSTNIQELEDYNHQKRTEIRKLEETVQKKDHRITELERQMRGRPPGAPSSSSSELQGEVDKLMVRLFRSSILELKHLTCFLAEHPQMFNL